jgi:phage portal protein BeeE
MNRINADIVDNSPILSTNIIHKIDRAQFVVEQSELHAFKDIVINNFILPNEKTIFNKLIESAEVSFVCYSLKHIGELLLGQKLAFREPYVYKSVLERIELPAGPEQILELIRNLKR